jgi:hypothetical protein
MVVGRRHVDADPATVFELLAMPARHCEIDGSGMLQRLVVDPGRVQRGDAFVMAMKMGPYPYRTRNEIIELEEGCRIAWEVQPAGFPERARRAMFGGNVWRYELESAPDGGTIVTETFDWSAARRPWFIRLLGFPRKNVGAIEGTLDRLAALC